MLSALSASTPPWSTACWGRTISSPALPGCLRGSLRTCRPVPRTQVTMASSSQLCRSSWTAAWANSGRSVRRPWRCGARCARSSWRHSLYVGALRMHCESFPVCVLTRCHLHQAAPGEAPGKMAQRLHVCFRLSAQRRKRPGVVSMRRPAVPSWRGDARRQCGGLRASCCSCDVPAPRRPTTPSPPPRAGTAASAPAASSALAVPDRAAARAPSTAAASAAAPVPVAARATAARAWSRRRTRRRCPVARAQERARRSGPCGCSCRRSARCTSSTSLFTTSTCRNLQLLPDARFLRISSAKSAGELESRSIAPREL
mmetsp:Transcript_15402/g.44100  ORF Transcript_15402/g.44100 Transcript_15402/m.44100 type:complete len:315 (-) Transcript_15402:299-1243(-)